MKTIFDVRELNFRKARKSRNVDVEKNDRDKFERKGNILQTWMVFNRRIVKLKSCPCGF